MFSLIKKPSAWTPIVISLGILAMLLGYLLKNGLVHETDEGTAAHLFQIWLVLEFLGLSFFGLKWLPRQPKQALVVVVIQCVAAFLPLSLVYYFKM